MKKKVVIWGAGKIGRGVAADLFREAGYSIVFVDSNRQLIDTMNNKGQYTVIRYGDEGKKKKTVIEDYLALHPSQGQALAAEIKDCEYLILSVLPGDIGAAGQKLADVVRMRMKKNIDRPMDIIILANVERPSAALKDSLAAGLEMREREYLNQYIGLVDTVITTTALVPGENDLPEDSLTILTKGSEDILLEGPAFKGEKPKIKGISFRDDLYAEGLKKLYTYNLIHAVYAYVGYHKGYRRISECIKNEEIQKITDGALNEAGEALSAEFGFQDMDAWNKKALDYINSPVLDDTLDRVGADPMRKLMNRDRLTGPALLCKDHGIWPYYLTEVIAYAFLFEGSADQNASVLKEYAEHYGVKKAAQKYCGLEMEAELLQMIERHYNRITQGMGMEEEEKVLLMKKAYHLGFMSEKKYKGCAQCVLQAMFELTGKADKSLFQSASGFSGGMAISGDGVCGGYSGGLMFMGSIVGRRLDEMKKNGDKEAQYISYTMAQKLRDWFLETYGSVVCADVHEEIFGQSYCLRTKAVRNEFEAAGAHTNKCTNVVGSACARVAEILYDFGYLK